VCNSCHVTRLSSANTTEIPHIFKMLGLILHGGESEQTGHKSPFAARFFGVSYFVTYSGGARILPSQMSIDSIFAGSAE
jgi:hypothetical protein